MENYSSLMQLDWCMMTGLHIEPNYEKLPESPKQDAVKVHVTNEVRKHQVEAKYMVTATFTFTWEELTSFYQKIEIGLRGLFSFPNDTPDDVISSYVPMLCVTNLYGTARGIVTQATGICPGGAYFLPLIDMNKALQTSQDESPPELEPKPKPPKRKRTAKVVNDAEDISESQPDTI